MDKKAIIKALTEEFVSGEKATKRAQKVSKSENSDYYKEVEKKMGDYDKDLKKEDDDKIDPKKNNYEGSEKEYHDEMEIRNGQEMIQYDREPSDQFKDRAKKSLEGHSTMGNKTYTGKENGNTEEVWGASGGKHGGEEVLKHAKASNKKRDDAASATSSMGDVPFLDPKKSKLTKKKIATESMKRIKFKVPFDGVEKALRLIPEAFKVNKTVFELTDGNEKYKIKWEGTLSEGRAIILEASDKNLLSEDMAKIKHLMGYKSETTLGIPSAKERVNENNQLKAGISQGFEPIEEYGGGGMPYDTNYIGGEDDEDDEDAIDENVFAGVDDEGQEDDENNKGGEMKKSDRDASDWEEKALGKNE